MRARIHKSLLMMGVISVALAFLLAIIKACRNRRTVNWRVWRRRPPPRYLWRRLLKARHTLMLFMMEIIRTSISYGLRIKGASFTIPMKLLEGTISRCPKSGRRSGRDPGKSFINRLMSIRKVM